LELNNQPPGALSKIRICDFTGQLAGAGATKMLATFGAQVIRVEDRLTEGGWDIFRGNGPWLDERRGVSLGGAFNNHNIEKLGVTLDMRKSDAKPILQDLISVSDVVTENFSAGVLDRWGFSYEEMKKIKPDIIYVSNSGFGHVGPYGKFKTWGPIVQAVSGLTFQSGLPDMPSAGWGFSYMDHTGAYMMAIAIMLAVFHRNQTGVGQWVDMSCSDAAATLNGPAILDYTVNNRPSRRPGQPNSNRSNFPRMAPHGIYECAGDDQWVAISVRDESEWSILCELMGMSDVEGQYQSLTERMEHQDEIDASIEQWTKSKTPMAVMDALQSRGVPAAAVQHPEDRMERDPNVEAWGLFPTVKHKLIGEVRVDGMPMKHSETPASIKNGAPVLGQHNQEIFGDVLGIDADIMTTLSDQGVI
jgi:crotonobetainyl-CoA:carnitine CoA-transferase CaiB-like acyl-CoA transferase